MAIEDYEASRGWLKSSLHARKYLLLLDSDEDGRCNPKMATKRTFACQAAKTRRALMLEERVKVIKMKDGASKIKDIIQEIDSLCTFISAASKFAQLQCLWRSKDAGQVSALTWALATFTCATRIYTTVATTGDVQVLVRFVVMTLLNLWVLLSVLHYGRHRHSTIKED